MIIRVFLIICLYKQDLLDDGIEKDHPDLIRNYDPLSSTDINDGDSDPNPRKPTQHNKYIFII